MARVHELRIRNDLTIEHLAGWSGVSKSTIYNTQKTLTDPRLYTVLRFRHALEVTWEELLGVLPEPVADRESPGPWLTQIPGGV